MSFVRSGNVVHHCELRAAAPGVRAPALLLVHALGSSLRIWDGVLAALRFRGAVLRHDLRGHGLSEVGECPYEIGSLGRDALRLLDQLELESVVVCGLSVGGLVAQELALSAPARVRGVVLCGTAARIGTREGWQARTTQVRAGGIPSVSDAVMARWFSPLYRSLEPDAVRGYRCLLERTSSEGYLAMVHALSEADLSERLSGLRAPALVISAELDEATPPADGRRLAELIPGAEFIELAGASHIMSVEKPRELAALIDGFMEERLGLESSAFERPGTQRPGIEGAVHG
jgi:3-oxoadipate enol-lactonase